MEQVEIQQQLKEFILGIKKMDKMPQQQEQSMAFMI